jgi:hypothetical protein
VWLSGNDWERENAVFFLGRALLVALYLNWTVAKVPVSCSGCMRIATVLKLISAMRVELKVKVTRLSVCRPDELSGESAIEDIIGPYEARLKDVCAATHELYRSYRVPRRDASASTSL